MHRLVASAWGRVNRRVLAALLYTAVLRLPILDTRTRTAVPGVGRSARRGAPKSDRD